MAKIFKLLLENAALPKIWGKGGVLQEFQEVLYLLHVVLDRFGEDYYVI